MMKGHMLLALGGNKLREGHTRYSVYDPNNQCWYYYEEGPTYANTYQITEYDEAGLAYLRRIESKHASPLDI